MRWLFPQKNDLRVVPRMVFGFLGNVALLIYVLPRRNHLFDTRDYRYVPLDLMLAFFLAAGPLFVLIAVLPVLRSEHSIHRWLGIALSIFPAYLAVVEWCQLLSLW